jgi:hypothetical protein
VRAPQPPGVRTTLSRNWLTYPKNVFEFGLSILRHRPEVKIAPTDAPELATRDFATIERWHLAGRELDFHGMRLRERHTGEERQAGERPAQRV